MTVPEAKKVALLNAEERREAEVMPLFRGVERRSVDRLLQHASIRRVPKNLLLFDEGSVPEFLHLLLSGCVEAFTRWAGRECTILIFSQADAFMPAAAIMGEQHLVAARTLKQSRLLLLDAGTVRQEMARCPIFACRVAALVAGQFRVALRHIKDLKTRNRAQRLAAYLLRLVDEKGAAGSAELPLPKSKLASRLGMSPETMSRSLQAVARHGLLVRGHRVFVQDRQKAERFCRLNALTDRGEAKLQISAW